MRNIVHVLEGCISYLNMFSIISKTKTNRFFESYPKERIFDVTENDVMMEKGALRARCGCCCVVGGGRGYVCW